MRRRPLDLLGAVLRRNQSITFLDLYYNDINSQAAATLAAALAGHSHSALTQLNLRHNRIGDAGADALAQALVRNTSLTALNLRNNSVSNRAAERLVHALIGSRTKAIDAWRARLVALLVVLGRSAAGQHVLCFSSVVRAVRRSLPPFPQPWSAATLDFKRHTGDAHYHSSGSESSSSNDHADCDDDGDSSASDTAARQ